MNRYTVIVLYPAFATDDYPAMTYTAFVEADDPRAARKIGAKQAWSKQPNETRGPLAAWYPLVVFEGHQQAVGYGWTA